MRLIEYTPEYFESLQRAVPRMGRTSNLWHRPFVDYYYATRDWCKLHLCVADDETILGTIGVERMRFESESREVTLGFATNFHALQPGVGGYLYMLWMKSCPIGIVFGGTHDAHKIYQKQNWTYFEGVNTYLLNKPYISRPGETWWRVPVKWALRHSFRTKISKYASRIISESGPKLTVQEEHAYSEDLLPRRSPFNFRFAPSHEYLGWRYNTELSFVRYRLFRILDHDTTAGYVIINDSPDQLIVSQCDGESKSSLAYGVLLSLLEIARTNDKPRAIILSSFHPEMQQVYEQFGFKSERGDRPFALGALRGAIDVPAKTSNWLINFDWGDSGLRAPFLDQGPTSTFG